MNDTTAGIIQTIEDYRELFTLQYYYLLNYWRFILAFLLY
jgi:hypothetical protein